MTSIAQIRACSTPLFALATFFAGAELLQGGQFGPILDSNGDPLPAGAFAQIGSSRLREVRKVDHLVFSPDGKTIASVGDELLGSGGSAIRLWDVESGKLRSCIRFERNDVPAQARRAQVGQALFSKDGKSLIYSRWESVPDVGKRMISRCSIGFWDLEKSEETRRLLGPKAAITVLALSKENKYLAAGDRKNHLTIWEVKEGKAIQVVNLQESITSLAFGHHEDMLLAGCDSGRVLALNVRDGTTLWSVDLQQKVTALAVHPEGKFFISASGEVRASDMNSGQLINIFPFRSSRLALSPDGKRIGFSGVHGLALCNAKGEEVMSVAPTGCHALVFSPDGRRFAAASGSRILISDASSGKRIHAFDADSVNVLQLLFSPDKHNLVIRDDNRAIRIINLQTQKVVRLIPKSPESNPAMDLSPDGKNFLYCVGREAILEVVATGNELSRFDIRRSGPGMLKFSPDGKLVAALPSDAGPFGFLELKSKKQVGRIDALGGWHNSVLAFSGDGKRLALAPTARGRGARDDVISVVSVPSGALVATLEEKYKIGTINRLTFFGQGRYLIAEDHTYHHYFNVSSEKVVYRDPLTAKRGPKGPCAVAPNEMIIARVDEDERIVVAELLTGRPIHAFPIENSLVFDLTFSPDGLWLGSVHFNRTALLWEWLGDTRPQQVRTLLPFLWERLAAEDAAKAYSAVAELVGYGNSAVQLFRKLLKVVPASTGERYENLIRDLESSEKRQAAYDALRNEVKEAEFFMVEGYEKTDCKETKKKLADLLGSTPMYYVKSDQIQYLRAIQVLEYIGSKEAIALLERLAQGAKYAPETVFATAALRRLALLPNNASPGLKAWD